MMSAELLDNDGEDQIAFRNGMRYVARLARPVIESTPAPIGQPFRLEITTPGILDRLALRAVPRQQPGAGEVEIEVHAAGLNFNDVMKAMGVYPGLPEGPVALGNECAGQITAVGAGVEGFAVGDNVVAIAPFSFGRFVIAPAPLVAPMPLNTTFDEAASIPLAFVTALYCLRHVARLAPGESVLIHAASGGVGIAAIQLARHLGAEVFATAGSPAKRSFLEGLGVQHVMDSRSLSFADEVLAATGGRGVDVVLNSLSGEAMLKSLDVVAPFGRFVEIGKRDIYENRQIGLLPFQKHLAYCSVDLARLFAERPSFCVTLFREVMEEFDSGVFSPPPIRTFPIADVVGAFGEMAQAKHIGKIVVQVAGAAQPVLADDTPIAFRSDRSYLITGGLGDLGLTVAEWMVRHGARHLALLGISEASAEARQVVAQISSAGAHARCCVPMLRASRSCRARSRKSTRHAAAARHLSRRGSHRRRAAGAATPKNTSTSDGAEDGGRVESSSLTRGPSARLLRVVLIDRGSVSGRRATAIMPPPIVISMLSPPGGGTWGFPRSASMGTYWAEIGTGPDGSTGTAQGPLGPTILRRRRPAAGTVSAPAHVGAAS